MSELKARRPAAVPAALAALLATVAILAGCGGPSSDAAQPAATQTSAAAAPTTRPAPKAGKVQLGDAPAYVALAVKDVTVLSRPRSSGDLVAVFPANLPWGSPTPFLITEARRTAAGDTWLRVLLPRRPNGSSGWVRREQVQVKPVANAVEVDLSSRTASLLRDHQRVRTWRVGVGTAATPTPTGRFYVTVKLRPPQISAGAYGAWALGLSAYSEVHQTFGTGDGQIALHGTYQPEKLGQPVSNGCVRMDNEMITLLAETLPLGTPVTIKV